ncbi:hypothetical protein ACWCOP_08095 [Maricaulaceae bacterium MS644]
MRKIQPAPLFFGCISCGVILAIVVLSQFPESLQKLAFLYFTPTIAAIGLLVFAAIMYGWVSGRTQTPRGGEIAAVCGFVFVSTAFLFLSLLWGSDFQALENLDTPIFEFWAYGLGALFVVSAIISSFRRSVGD